MAATGFVALYFFSQVRSAGNAINLIFLAGYGRLPDL
jgi:hypothetical protein